MTALAGITGSASGGMDMLPHNGAVITLIKTAAVVVAIVVFYLTGIY